MLTKIQSALFLFLYAFFPVTVTAQVARPLGLPNPIKYKTINEFLLAILNIVVQMGVVVVVFFLVYAGFQFVTAQGNTEKIQKAKSMLVWVVVGAFVILGVYVIRAAICGTLRQIGVSCSI